MLEFLFNIPLFWFHIWTAGNADEFVALYTGYLNGILLVAVGLLAVSFLATTFGPKKVKPWSTFWTGVNRWTIGIAAALAVAPIGVPLLVAYIIGRAAWSSTRQPPTRRQRPEPEEDEEE